MKKIEIINLILLFVVIATFVVSAVQTVQIVKIEKALSSDVKGVSAPASQGPSYGVQAPSMVGGC